MFADVPETIIEVIPFLVVILQVAKMLVRQEMALAGTPFSVSLRLNQLLPETFMKLKTPPLFAVDVNEKWVPTDVQLEPHTGSRMITPGSVTSANAADVPNKRTRD